MVNIEEKRLRARWALCPRSESGKQTLNKGCRGCVPQLHQETGHSSRLILQEEGAQVGGKTFLIGF